MQMSSMAYAGVEALVRLAAQAADKPCTAQGLAEWINRSATYTESLMARLRHAGLVVARHGRGGGYTLARPAHRITVADVLQAVDQPSGLSVRPLNAARLEAVDVRNLHGTDLLWESLRGYVLLFLNGVSLADLTPETAELIGDDGADQVAIHAADMQSTARH